MIQTDFPLPPDLPVPVDDGAATHLTGMMLPPLVLRATDGEFVKLSVLPGLRAVLYLYPMTGRPGVSLPDGWDLIPGARGCTPEACGFRDHRAQFVDIDAVVYGLSSQDSAYQQEFVDRLDIPYPLLSDPEFQLAEALRLPTFEVEGRRLYKRLTMVISNSHIEHVFYPVFRPDTHADEVASWLASSRPT
jgi:peroxiredoxin